MTGNDISQQFNKAKPASLLKMPYFFSAENHLRVLLAIYINRTPLTRVNLKQMAKKDYEALLSETDNLYLKFHQHLFLTIEQYLNVFDTPAGPDTWRKFKDLKILMPQHFIGFHHVITLMVKCIGIKENGVIFNLSTYQYSDQRFNIDQMANPTGLPLLKQSLWPDKYGPTTPPSPLFSPSPSPSSPEPEPPAPEQSIIVDSDSELSVLDDDTGSVTLPLDQVVSAPHTQDQVASAPSTQDPVSTASTQKSDDQLAPPPYDQELPPAPQTSPVIETLPIPAEKPAESAEKSAEKPAEPAEKPAEKPAKPAEKTSTEKSAASAKPVKDKVMVDLTGTDKGKGRAKAVEDEEMELDGPTRKDLKKTLAQEKKIFQNCAKLLHMINEHPVEENLAFLRSLGSDKLTRFKTWSGLME